VVSTFTLFFPLLLSCPFLFVRSFVRSFVRRFVGQSSVVRPSSVASDVFYSMWWHGSGQWWSWCCLVSPYTWSPCRLDALTSCRRVLSSRLLVIVLLLCVVFLVLSCSDDVLSSCLVISYRPVKSNPLTCPERGCACTPMPLSFPLIEYWKPLGVVYRLMVSLRVSSF